MSDVELLEIGSVTAEELGEEIGGKPFTGKLTGKNTSSYSMQVVVSAQVKSNGGRGACLIGAWRRDSYPIGRFDASVHYYTGADVHVAQNSASAIIPPGGRWEAYATQTSPTVEFRIWAVYLK